MVSHHYIEQNELLHAIPSDLISLANEQLYSLLSMKYSICSVALWKPKIIIISTDFLFSALYTNIPQISKENALPVVDHIPLFEYWHRIVPKKIKKNLQSISTEIMKLTLETYFKPAFLLSMISIDGIGMGNVKMH